MPDFLQSVGRFPLGTKKKGKHEGTARIGDSVVAASHTESKATAIVTVERVIATVHYHTVIAV